MKNHKSN